MYASECVREDVCVSLRSNVSVQRRDSQWSERDKESENDRERGLFETDDIFFSMYNIFP